MSDQENEDKRKKERKKDKKKNKGVRLFPANKKGYHIMRWLNFFKFFLLPWNAVLYPYKMYGNTKIGKGACIFVGNHFCMWDVLYPARATKEGIHFLAKSSLTQAPVLRHWAVLIGAIEAMRDGSDVRALMDAMKCLKNGEKVSLFPEGTRNRVSDEEFLPFHGGFALMAIKTQSPIIPFVICNRPRLFHRTHVVFGDPIELTEYYERKVAPEEYAEIEEKIKQRMYELRDEHRAFLEAKKKKKGKKCKS